MYAIQAREPGDAQVLTHVELPDPVPRPGEVLVQVAFAGINFIDTYRRSGVYPMSFPHTVGEEGSGVVLAVGDGVGDWSPGQRVAWFDAPGSYAEQVVVRADRLLAVPTGVSAEAAAALPMQGITVHYLANSTYPVADGDFVLVHAGAGGVGLLLTQLATARGGRVISTVSTAEKAGLSRDAGALEAIRYDQLDDLIAELPPLVRAATGGDGVAVAYDGVGKATFDASLASLRRRGTLVLFGGASGQVPPFDPQRLNAAGSVYLTRPKIGDYTASIAELRWRAAEVFTAAADGRLRVRIGQRLPLAEAAAAHRALEGRATTGKVLLEVAPALFDA